MNVPHPATSCMLYRRATSYANQKVLASALCMLAAVSAAAGSDMADAQFLPDLAGFVNRLEVTAGAQNYEVIVTSNFAISDYMFDSTHKRLVLHTGPLSSTSLAEIEIPVELLSGDLKTYVDPRPPQRHYNCH